MQDSDKRQSASKGWSFLSCSGNVVFFFFGYTVSSGSMHNLKFPNRSTCAPAIEAAVLTTGPSGKSL